MSLTEAAQQLINGLSLGGTYALLALGLAMVFSILRLINFAHGEVLTLSSYALWKALDGGIPWPVAILVALGAGALSAVAMERLAFRPLRGASVVTLLLTSFSLSFLIQTLLTTTIGARPKGVPVPEWTSDVVRLGDLSFPVLDLATIALTIVALALLSVMLARTRTGKAMRAAAEDFTTVRLMGINANRVVLAAFAISGLLAGLVAVLLTARTGSIEPGEGTVPLIKAFTAVIIGGLGSLRGAVVGGFVVGLTEVLLQATLPGELLPFRDAFALVVLIGILLVRPRGLLGQRTDLGDRRVGAL